MGVLGHYGRRARWEAYRLRVCPVNFCIWICRLCFELVLSVILQPVTVGHFQYLRKLRRPSTGETKTNETLESERLLRKEWNRYKMWQHMQELQVIQRAFKLQATAIEELKKISPELSAASLQVHRLACLCLLVITRFVESMWVYACFSWLIWHVTSFDSPIHTFCRSRQLDRSRVRRSARATRQPTDATRTRREHTQSRRSRLRTSRASGWSSTTPLDALCRAKCCFEKAKSNDSIWSRCWNLYCILKRVKFLHSNESMFFTKFLWIVSSSTDGTRTIFWLP